MLAQLTPAVVDTNVAAAPRAPVTARREREGHLAAAREEHRDALVLVAPGIIAIALIADVRREQREDAVALERADERAEANALHDDVALGIGDDRLLDLVAAARARVDQPIARHSGGEQMHDAPCVALFLGEEGCIVRRAGIRDEQSEIARVRLVDARVVHLVENTVRDREPDEAAAVERGADTTLCAGGPSGFETRTAGRG